MNEFTVWEPVSDFAKACECESPDCSVVLEVNVDGNTLHLIGTDGQAIDHIFFLPDHLRLCRQIFWHEQEITAETVNDLYDRQSDAMAAYFDARLAHDQLKDRLKILFDQQVSSGELTGSNDYQRRSGHRQMHPVAYADLYAKEEALSLATADYELAKNEVDRLRILLKLREE